MTEHAGAVIVFDGVCALCSRWVRFLLRFDRHGRVLPLLFPGSRILERYSP